MEEIIKEPVKIQKYRLFVTIMVSKWSYMLSSFGSNTLMILFFVYWSQGFKSLSFLAVTLYYKETLGLEPSTTQFIRTLTMIAWLIKPIYGLITDNFKLFGYYRKSYLFISGIVGSISAFSIFFSQNVYFSVFALTLNEFSQAFCDVIADAIMVEKSRNDESGSSTLQSFSWTVVAIAGIIGSILGGLLLETYSPQVIIAFSAICPLLLVYCSTKFEESPPTNNKGIKESCKLLWDSIKKPEILKPLIFILILGATSPRYSELMTYYLRDVLKFSSIFLSSLGLISYSSLIVGSAIYYRWLKDMEYRNVIFIGQILLIIINFFDIGLVTGFYQKIHIPAWAFVAGEDVFGTTIGFTFKMLPLLVLSAKICPIGVEGTFYALFTSVANISFSLSGIFGGFLISIFDVKTGQYELIWLLILIQCFTKAIPLCFLSLLPRKELKNDESIELQLFEDDN